MLGTSLAASVSAWLVDSSERLLSCAQHNVYFSFGTEIILRLHVYILVGLDLCDIHTLDISYSLVIRTMWQIICLILN